MARGETRQERQDRLQQVLEENPFLTDEELADLFGVSVQTVRLDRLALGIPELRERMREVARHTYSQVKALGHREIVGELIDLELGRRGISVLETTEDMAFERTRIVRGHLLFAQAESLALAIIDAEMALTGVVNVKYKRPARVGEKLVAKAEIIRHREDNEFVVLVVTRAGEEQVFRGKFMIHALSGRELLDEAPERRI